MTNNRLLFASLVVLMGCSNNDSSTVTVDINPDVDFSSFSTFALIDPIEEVPEQPSIPEFGDEVEAAMDTMLQAMRSELEGLGLTEDVDNPDVLAHPLIAVEKYDGDLVWYDYWYGYYYGYEYQWTTPVSFDYGALAVDVVDTQGTVDEGDDVLAMRGVAERIFFQDSAGNDLLIRNAMHDIFAEWPQDEE